MMDKMILDLLTDLMKENSITDHTPNYSDDGKIIKIKETRSLNLSNTDIKELPITIEILSGLQSLDVSGTQLSMLPESIGNLIGLQSLNISNTQISALPESIGNLTGLQNLNISNTQISALPESIGNLTGLQNLNISNTQISALPENIGNLTSLESLDVSNTQTSALPESIGNLTGLQSLNISNTQISALPENTRNLTGLQRLDVSNTHLSMLSEAIGVLNKLTYLDISGTDITSLNSELWKNASLETVILEDLILDRIPEDVFKTGLAFILQKKSEFDWDKKGIFIHNLSLSKQPISLFYSKRELIERYYREETVSVNSAKIIFLGDGAVGKTYTLKRLLNGGKRATDKDTYPTHATHGVIIKPYHFTDSNGHYDIKLWDFGGQQIMHSMHRCFLTERSCYVVIISTRTDRDLLEQARYWLQTVSSFTPDSPVILLVNQWTKNLVGADEYRLREEFVNLKQILYFSVVDAEDETFLTLKDAIAAQVRQLDGYGMEFPKSWHELMTDLENEKRYYIPKSTYYQKCFEKGLIYEDTAREGICEWLLDWFNDLGICFSYHKNSNSQILDSYELLNPQWLCRAAYMLINYGKQESDNGILTRKQIETILEEAEPLDFDGLGSVSYEPNQIEYILEILRKFQISFLLPDGRELFPALCDDNSSESARPEWFIQDEMQHTSYEFQYKYLPDTIIHRLMIFCYQSHYHVRYRWRRGMSVGFGSDDTSRLAAVIDSGSDTRSITIDIYSDGLIPCWQFLSKLREEILKINIELGLEAMEFIYMETDGVKDRFSVKYILNRRLKGWKYLPAVNYDGDYSIIDILGAAYGSENATLIEELLDSKNNKINDVLTLIERINDLLKRRDIKLTAKEILNNFFLEYQDKCPRFTDFQQYIKDNNSDELQKYLHIELKDLGLPNK